jgi:hypothetical protein
VKFGLRNAPDIYPSGLHLENVAVLMARERVRRAELGLALLRRHVDQGGSAVQASAFTMSPVGAIGAPGIPVESR